MKHFASSMTENEIEGLYLFEPMSHTQPQNTRRFRDSGLYFAVFQLPSLLFTAMTGFILEFLIEFPFMMVCLLEQRARRRRKRGQR